MQPAEQDKLNNQEEQQGKIFSKEILQDHQEREVVRTIQMGHNQVEVLAAYLYPKESMQWQQYSLSQQILLKL